MLRCGVRKPPVLAMIMVLCAGCFDAQRPATVASDYIEELRSLIGTRFVDPALLPGDGLVTHVEQVGTRVNIHYKQSVRLPLIGGELSKWIYVVPLELAGDAADVFRRIKGAQHPGIPMTKTSKAYADYVKNRSRSYGR